MVLIEATAAGVPVLIADPDLEEILPAGGYILTKDETPDEIAKAINKICKHPEVIEKMSKVQIAARGEKGMNTKIQKLEDIFRNSKERR